MKIDELDTPAAVVDLDKMETAIARLQKHLDEHKIANRPHIKTHKIPEIAHMQVRAGAVGITCQKIGEAEVMAQAGIRDIFLPYNIVGEVKLARLMRLARRVTLSVTADSEYTVRGLARAAEVAGLTLTTLVEFDTGFKRCGVQSPEEAAALAVTIDGSPGLRFGGLMTFPANENTDPFARETKALLSAKGIPVEIVSGGSTPGMWQAQTHPELTEYRAGMYVYGDRNVVKRGALTYDECSFSIIATVVSRPTADRGILDGGSKTFSNDLMGLEGYGYIVEYPEAKIYALSEEHGHVDFSACAAKPQIGERVRVIVNHCCVANNCFREVVGLREGEVEVVWPVAAHGRMQ
jgi:D-serine deaminase-like pyridoxal phosphate-dependent protein